jgi:uncharacterized protein YndB with AHSA1/START domain
MKDPIIISLEINAPLEKVWNSWTNPEDIVKWNFASNDWYCPKAENDLKVGGKLKSTMAAKDGSFSFDFTATYTKVDPMSQIDYTIEDGREVSVLFGQKGDKVIVTESFEAEDINSRDIQYEGWKAIMENFRKYVEA